jgi:hypothetical protein
MASLAVLLVSGMATHRDIFFSSSNGMGLNVRDFGATGDGVTDDAVAIQKALDASQESKRALLFPAGEYMTSVELIVRCTSEDYGNGTRKNVRSPVRLLGEGWPMTRITAMKPMRSVLHLNDTEDMAHGGPAPHGHTANGHELEGIAFDAVMLANYSVYAPATTRSAFRRLGFFGARASGFFLGFGWINVVAECKFTGNGIALRLDNNINSVQILNNIIESNRNVGVYVNGGTAVEITGNCIESAGGPAIVANGVKGLAVRGNYYEANNVAPAGAMVFVDETTGAPIHVCTDLVLNGAVLSTAIKLPNLTLGSNPKLDTSGATVSGNYHNPKADLRCKAYAGVFAYGAVGVVVETNHAGGCSNSPDEPPTAPKCAAFVAGPSVASTSYRVALNTGGFAT